MFSEILVPLDGSAVAERAVPAAEMVARAFGARIRLIRVLEPARAGGLSRDCVEWQLQQAEAGSYLDALAERLRGHEVEAEAEVLEGKPAEGIVQASRKGRADLIVLSAWGQGGPGPHWLGGTAHKVVSTAGCSVLLVRGAALEPDAEEVRLSRILVPVDCSQRSEWALRVAASLARAGGAELVAAHVIPVPEMPTGLPRRPEDAALRRSLVQNQRRTATRYLAEMKRSLSGADLEIRTVVEASSRVTRTLNRIALREGASLVVVSAHGASGPSPWPFGSVAGGLLTYGDLPLLVLREAGEAREPERVERPAAAEITLHAAAH